MRGLATRRWWLTLLLASGCGGGGGIAYLPDANITSHPPLRAVVGVRYAYNVKLDPTNSRARFSLGAHPDGMVILEHDGIVVWTPTLADLGLHTVKVKVHFDLGDDVDDDQTYILRVDQDLELGTTLSWRGHSNQGTPDDLEEHLARHAPWGRVIGFHSNWRDPGAHAGEVPATIELGASNAASHGYRAELTIGWADGNGVPDLASDADPADDSWTNAETRAEFLDLVVAVAATWRPAYLLLGNETNVYFLTHGADEWNAWISEYEACYDAVKAASPATMVATVFQLERMKGLGAKIGWSDPPQWGVVDALAASGKADAIGFTAFAWLEYDDPAAIPAGYADEIAQHWSGPVIFSELGWLAGPSGPYSGSEQQQSDFVALFFDRTQQLDLELCSWLFLHDWDQQASTPAFANVGLRDNLASVIRPADGAWQAAVTLRQR